MHAPGSSGGRRSTRSQALRTLDYAGEDRHRSKSLARTLSNATLRNSIASTTSPLQREQQRRRRLVRKSLLRPKVHELTIEQRARILADVAGDCLVKVIRAGLQSSEDTWLDCERAWHGFQTMRSSYILGENPPPIVLYEDIVEELSLHSSGDLVGLNRAMELCNLTTLAYFVCRPDEAGAMGDPPLSRKGKERARPAFLAAKVTRRNEVMCAAWEKYWMILPEDQRDKESALRLWLQLGTQIYLNFQVPSIYPPSAADDALPDAPPAVVKTLFDPFAIRRFGRWGLDTSGDSQTQDFAGMDQEIVEARWRRAVDRRQKEVSSGSLDDLRRKYLYEDFRQAFLEYLDNMVSSGYLIETGSDIIGSSDVFEDSDHSRGVSHVRSSRKPSLEGPDYPTTETEDNFTPRRVTRSGRQAPSRSIKRFRAQLDPLEGTTSESEVEASDLHDDKEEDETGEPIQWDLFQDIAMLMQEQCDRQATPSVTLGPGRTTDQRRYLRHSDTDEDPEWEVHDGATPRALVPHGAQPQSASFNFVSRQADAMQVDWDSRTPVQGRQLSEAPSVPYNDRRAPPPLQPSPAVDRQFADTSGDDGEGFARSPSLASIPSVSLPPSPPSLHLRPSWKSLEPIQAVNAEPVEEWSQSVEDAILVQATAPRREDDEDESSEETEGVENGDLDMEDLMPDTLQLTGDLQSSAGPQTPDPDLQDLMPSQSQILGSLPSSDDSQKTVTTHPAGDGAVRIADENDDPFEYAPPMDFDMPGPEETDVPPIRMPTSQRRLASSRVDRSHDAFEYAMPDSQEDAEDRILLDHQPQPDWDRPESDIQSLKQSPPPSPPLRAVSPSIDPYLVDEDGNPLATNPKYVIPRDYIPKQSRLHGNVDNKSSSYIRFSGPRKWSPAEALLLYRTIQQVPLEEPFAPRVVWYLHGEHGILSKALRDHNPQHMKDKMRTIVTTRANNQRIIVGRARAWLKPDHPLRQEYEREMQEMRDAARREADARNVTQEEEQAEEEEDSDEDYESGKGAKRKTKRKPTRKKRAAKHKRVVHDNTAGTGHDDDVYADADLDELASNTDERRPAGQNVKKKSPIKRRRNKPRASRPGYVFAGEAETAEDADGAEAGPSRRITRAAQHRDDNSPALSGQRSSARGEGRAESDTANEGQPPAESAFEDPAVEAQDAAADAEPPSARDDRRGESAHRNVLVEVVLPARQPVVRTGRTKRTAPPKRPRNLKTKAARKTIRNPLDDEEDPDEGENCEEDDSLESDPSRINPNAANEWAGDDAESEIVDDELADLGNAESDPVFPPSGAGGGGSESLPGTLAEERAKRNIHEFGLRSSGQAGGEVGRTIFDRVFKKVNK